MIVFVVLGTFTCRTSLFHLFLYYVVVLLVFLIFCFTMFVLLVHVIYYFKYITRIVCLHVCYYIFTCIVYCISTLLELKLLLASVQHSFNILPLVFKFFYVVIYCCCIQFYFNLSF